MRRAGHQRRSRPGKTREENMGPPPDGENTDDGIRHRAPRAQASMFPTRLGEGEGTGRPERILAPMRARRRPFGRIRPEPNAFTPLRGDGGSGSV